VIMQLQSHCLEKHQTSISLFFFLSRFYLSIKIFSTKKTLSRNFVSDVQTKSSTISFTSNCDMSENFKSYVHILHIDNEWCCLLQIGEGQFCQGSHKSCVWSTYIWQHQCMLFTVKNFTVREHN
jgi:hypothetical protein